MNPYYDLFLKLNPLEELLSKGFPNGDKITSLDIRCDSCKRELDETDCRGTLTEDLEKVWLLQGLAACQHCTLLQAFTVEITLEKDDLKLRMCVNEIDWLEGFKID